MESLKKSYLSLEADLKKFFPTTIKNFIYYNETSSPRSATSSSPSTLTSKAFSDLKKRISILKKINHDLKEYNRLLDNDGVFWKKAQTLLKVRPDNYSPKVQETASNIQYLFLRFQVNELKKQRKALHIKQTFADKFDDLNKALVKLNKEFLLLFQFLKYRSNKILLSSKTNKKNFEIISANCNCLIKKVQRLEEKIKILQNEKDDITETCTLSLLVEDPHSFAAIEHAAYTRHKRINAFRTETLKRKIEGIPKENTAKTGVKRAKLKKNQTVTKNPENNKKVIFSATKKCRLFDNTLAPTEVSKRETKTENI